MNISKQFPIGIFLGILIGLALFYSLSQNSQVNSLQSQVKDLENRLSQLTNQTTQQNPSPNSIATSSPTPSITSNGEYTEFEKLQYTSAYVTSTSTGWTIYMNVQNTGTAAATINNIFLNGQPFSTYPVAGGVPTVLPAPNTAGVIATLPAGQSTTLNITLSNAELATSGTGFVWNSGMSVEVAIQSAAGNSYPKTMALP